MCRCLNIGTNSYYRWLRHKDQDQVNETTVYLKQRIQMLFKESKEIYGSVRICEMLKREGLHYHRSYIATLMREMGLKSVLSKSFKVCTTDSNHSFTVAENKLDRNFDTDKLGHKWVSDITYIKVKDQWNYVTTIMDLADRKIIAWTLSEDMTTENTVYKAWLQASKTRNITQDHIFHSDRGVQYASHKMTFIFHKNLKINQSMSGKGNCWDNAVAESFFKTLKYECTNRYQFKSFLQAYQIIDEYIQW